MNKKTKVILVAGIVIIIVSVLAYTSLQQVSAKKSSGDYMDFSADVPFQIQATSGTTLTVPVTIYGSTTTKSVDVVVTHTDPKFGIGSADAAHPQIPPGFTISLPVTHIQMQAMNEVAHQKPLMTTNMTISVANTIKPGVYGFAINMLSTSPDGLPADHASAFYVNVQ